MINKVMLIGRLGKKPTIYNTENGRLVRFSLATSEYYKKDGQRVEKTEWHSIFVSNPACVEFCEKTLDKGSLVYVEGKIKSRESEGKTYTEIVVPAYTGSILAL